VQLHAGHGTSCTIGRSVDFAGGGKLAEEMEFNDLLERVT
jgi:hypothetical protein